MNTHYKDKNMCIYKVTSSLYDNKAYILVDNKSSESIIIDTPENPNELIRIAKDTLVKAILITHNHIDHIQGLQEVAYSIPSPIGIGEADAGALLNTPDFYLKDNDIITAGTISLKAISTPGHTPGSTCFIVGQHLFSGDTLFPGGPGKSESPQTLTQIVNSITQKLFIFGDNVTFYPGHGRDGNIGVSKQEYRVFKSKKHPEDLCGDIIWLKH